MDISLCLSLCFSPVKGSGKNAQLMLISPERTLFNWRT